MPLLGWLILAFIVAVVLAAIHGARSAGRAIRERYRVKRQLAREAVAAGLAPKALSRGNKAGMAIGATITGPGLTLRALLEGLRIGWRAGRRWAWRRRARVRIDRRNARRAAAAAADAAPPGPRGCPWWDDASGQECGRPLDRDSRYCPRHTVRFKKPPEKPPTPPSPKPPAGGKNPMPIETKTNGEVQTREQLEAELKATVKEATDELEAAQADRQAIDEEVTRVGNIEASLARFEIDSETRKAVIGIVGPTATQKTAHEMRVNAADAKAKAAQLALDTFLNAGQTKFHANAN